MPSRKPTSFLLLAALGALACSDTPVEPEAPARLVFSVEALELGLARTAQLEIRNAGGSAVGPVGLAGSAVRGADGGSIPGARVLADPDEIPTLNPGDARLVSVEISLGSSLNAGVYDATLTAAGPDGTRALLPLSFEVEADGDDQVATLSVVRGAGAVRTGDVVHLRVEARNAAGRLLEGAAVQWSMEPANAGLLSAAGSFVAYRPGAVTLTARAAGLSDSVVLEVGARGLTGSFTVLGEGVETRRFTSDLWIHGDFAYTGTWGTRSRIGGVTPGNTLHTWLVRDPAAPARIHALEVDARTVNDVKVRADGTRALITHEGSDDGLNGVTFLDLADPAAPAVIGRFTQELEPGVHNAWIEGDHAYLVVDGPGGGLRVLDVSDPSAPTVVSRFYAGTSFLHDVYVRDGLAFLSHWNAGLVILDVGNGMAGGSPAAPIEVSRLPELGGQTHNAWYWPDAGYVFVGEEDFATPGIVHVVDVRNPTAPREVATFAVDGQTPHNFWLDEERGVLYIGWYANGVRALDVSGDLMGELDRQGREIAGLLYNGGGIGCNLHSDDTCTWAPQLHRGVVWVSDMNRGLIALQPPG